MNKNITNIIIFAFVSMVFFACQPGGGTEEVPQDLAGKQKLLSQKKQALKNLKSEIEMLEGEVAELMPDRKEKSVDVNSVNLEKQTFESYVKIQGSIMTDDLVNASSETGGRIVSLLVNEGEYVQKGSRIASMDLESLEKSLNELETQYGLAKTVFERQERLWKQEIGSELQYLQAKNNKEALEKSMETLKFQLTKKDVYAPIGGYVDMVFLKQGEMAAAGMPIVSILNTSKVKIVADVPETYLPSVDRGTMVDVYFPALDKEMKKKISMIGRSIDPSNRTFKIELNTSNPGGTLKPNLLAELLIRDKEIKDAVVIPLDVVRQEVTGDRYVYVVERKDGEARARKVLVKGDTSYENSLMIDEGLNGDEELIILGLDELENNILVNVVKKSDEDEG